MMPSPFLAQTNVEIDSLLCTFNESVSGENRAATTYNTTLHNSSNCVCAQTNEKNCTLQHTHTHCSGLPITLLNTTF